jgi:hypothetical protein
VTEPVEGELLDPAGPHDLIKARTRGALGYLSCSCGEWEAVVTGSGSARWALDDHRRHCLDAARALPPG